MKETIRELQSAVVSAAVKRLFITANKCLPEGVKKKLAEAKKAEESALAANVLGILTDNITIAEERGLPVCQDTGMAVVFAEIGKDVHLLGESLEDAINRGVREAYLDGKLRLSVVRDPFFDRTNTGDNTPAVIYTRQTYGTAIRLTVLPKGFGSENMSAVRMFTPSATREEIMDFVVGTVAMAGSNPCPPIVVGVGIGGTFDYAAVLSKKALIRELDSENEEENYRELEKEILEKINALGIGAQGFGGKTTALAVLIEHAPTHIAGLPVAVNICCHVDRHLTEIL